MTTRVALATSNPGKRAELEPLFESLDIELELPTTAIVENIEETGMSFVENALIKGRTVAKATGLPAIADDSGLMVDALGGKPGIHSARYAGEPSDAARNNAKLLKTLYDCPDRDRAASFVCTLVFLRDADDPLPLIGHGRWTGRILREPVGENGFGYDPLFFDERLQRSAAEMPAATKNAISHRALAAKQLCTQLVAIL